MKSANTFGIQFVVRTSKTNKTSALLYARITANKKVLEISLKRKVETSQWDNGRERVRGNRPDARSINNFINDVRYRLTELYQELLKSDQDISSDIIKSLFLGEKKDRHTILSLIGYHNSKMKGVIKPGTLKNYFTTEKYVKRFLKERMDIDDLILTKLNYHFITEFEVFLRTCKPLDESNKLTNNGIIKHLERLKKMAGLAYKLEWIPKHPFEHYQLRLQKTEMTFLNSIELKKLENVIILQIHLERVRDLFVFSCYTGLSYADVSNLSVDNLIIGVDGEKWIKTSRQKTNTPVNVPLLPKAIQILEKYKNDPQVINRKQLLPVIANQKVNFSLKKIANLCGIDKDLTFHLARHTFSTTVTLANGVPIETVSRMLGHTKLSTTQIYVHVLERKISDDMKILREKIG